MYRRVIKRVLDVSLSFMAILCLLWLFAIIGIAVLIGDGRPVIYTQYRLGYRGKKFKLYKFRTMIKNADSVGPLHTVPQDKRVTKVGKVLRKTSLDELPQLFNIMKGDMSIVGNRPAIYKEYSLLDEVERQRIEVLPGLTGLAAVNGRSVLTVSEKLMYELEYVEKCSFMLDCRILLRTVKVVLLREGVNSAIKTNEKEEVYK